MNMVIIAEEHINLGLENQSYCFYCNKPRDIIFSDSQKPPTEQTVDILDKTPCLKCQQFMKQGIILISVREPILKEYREHYCYTCGNYWYASITLSSYTSNLSGEATAYCPQCGYRAMSSSTVYQPDDLENPPRTGGWVVVQEEYITRLLRSDLCDSIFKERILFIVDGVWDKLGLPR